MIPEIFREPLEKARRRSGEMGDLLARMRRAIEDTREWLAKAEEYLEQRGWWYRPDLAWYLEQLDLGIGDARREIRRLERRIPEVEDEQLDLDLWILEKEEIWSRLDEEVLREQVGRILDLSESLSRLVVGRRIGIAFDVNAESGLAYVNALARHDQRKVFLSTRLLETQPDHVVDLHQALLVHELGHYLLHFKESSKAYRRVRRLLEEKISCDSQFFSLLNILLDEHLERSLRDRRRDWRISFSRLYSYMRLMPERELRRTLARGLARDAREIDLVPFLEKGWIKIQGQPPHATATILSGEMLTEDLGFPRLQTFFWFLRLGLPRQTARQDWLLDCLGAIPKDFKSLDLFGLHRLACEIYRLMFPGTESQTIRVRVSGKVLEIPVPGTWRVAGDQRKLHDLGGADEEEEPDPPESPGAPAADPEGEPPAPPPPLPPLARKRPRLPPYGRGGRRGGGGSSRIRGGHHGIGWGQCESPAGGSGGGSGSTRDRPDRPDLRPPAPSGVLGAKGKAKERARQAQERARANEKREREKDESPPPSPPLPPDRPPAVDLQELQELAEAPIDSAPPQLAGGLNRLLKDIRRQRALERQSRADSPTPEESAESSFKNTGPELTIPALEQVETVPPDAIRTRELVRRVSALVRFLRPHFQLRALDRDVVEFQGAGRAIPSAGIYKFLAYREIRIFRAFKFEELERYGDVHVAILVDVSASMASGGRLEKAQSVAALLAECFSDCAGIASFVCGFNQNLYLCGTHEDHSIAALSPKGKTNEAGALDWARKRLLASGRRTRIALILSDGLPTRSTVASVVALAARMEGKDGIRLVHGALSDEVHPAYRSRIDLSGPLDARRIGEIGRTLARRMRP